MRCPTCGYEPIPDGAQVCPRCQTDLTDDQGRSVSVSVDMDVGTIMSGASVTGIDIKKARDVFINTDRRREAQNRRNRLSLQDIVWASWIEGVLEKIEATHASLTGGQPLIRLNKRWLPEAVDSRSDASAEVSHLAAESTAIDPEESVVDIFDQGGRSLLILGQPGSGKTVTLLEIAREGLRRAWQDPEQPIPIVLNLASWAEKRLPLADWIVHQLSTPQYRVPQDISLDWLENNELVVLLDGLDEVATPLRDDCIRAINRFTAEHFAGIVVCCADQDYRTVAGDKRAPGDRLELRSAFLVEPITSEQIDAYFGAAGDRLAALRAAIQQDPGLQDLVKTPLVLTMMSVTYQDVAADQLPKEQPESASARREQLFAAYVKRMFAYKGAGDQPFSDDQTVKWLSWLAGQMEHHQQSMFLIEGLQPSWLPAGRWQVAYMITSRTLVTLVGGFIGGLILGLANSLTGDWRYLFLGFVQGILGGVTAGLASGVVDTLWLLRRGAGHPVSPRGQLRETGAKFIALALSVWLAVIFVFGLLSVLVQGTALAIALSLGQGLQVGLILALCCGWVFAFGPDGVRHGLSNDIQSVEQLSWSRDRAFRSGLRGAIIGIVAGLIASFIARYTPLVVPIEAQFDSLVLVVLIMMAIGGFFLGLAGVVLGGIRGSVINTAKLRPNQGFTMSLYNAAVTGPLVGGLFGLLGALIGWFVDGWQTVATMGLYGIFFGVVAALWYGGFFAVQHTTLRTMLARLGRIPRLGRLTPFLDYASRRIFLRKVGGGYIFIHRYLQAYFAGNGEAAEEELLEPPATMTEPIG